MTRAELKENAKAQIKGKIWKLFVVTLIVGGIIALCSLIPKVGSIAEFCLASAFSISLIMIYLKLTRNEDFEIGEVFEGFHIIGKAIWLEILMSVFTMLWSLLLVIPGIIKAYSYSMAPYILAENPDMAANDAIKESMRIMDGHKMDLFVLQLSFIGWMILTSLTFGILGIYTVPYMNATFANFYNSVKDTNGAVEVEKTEKVEEPEKIEENKEIEE